MGYATTFERGDFVPDRRPLKSKDSRDLRELALTLPIWESESEDSTKWVYENSSVATAANHWTTPADGAQSAVELKRLPVSPNGAQRLEIWVPPSKLNGSPGSVSWTSIVERRNGGWLVQNARKDNGYVEVNRVDGRGKCYNFSKTGRTIQWKSGTFREDKNG